MNAWQWSIRFLLILKLVQSQISKNDTNESSGLHSDVHQERKRRDLVWSDSAAPNVPATVNDEFPTYTKRNPILSRLGGHRLSDLLYFKRRPAFSSWGGKRGPAFSSWGGKRSIANNIIDQNSDEFFYDPKGKAIIYHDKMSNYQRNNNEIPDEDATHKTQNEILNNPANIHQSLQNGINNNAEYKSLTSENLNNKIESINEHKLQENEDDCFENNDIKDYNNDEFYSYEDTTKNTDDPSQANFNFENDEVSLLRTSDKRTSPSFNKWGSNWFPAMNHWQGKKAVAFNSWGGKRAPAFNSWGGKRAPAFNSWGGKRAPAFNSWGGKRAPAFNSWGGKRAPAFNSWGGKRAPAFNSWGGKRAPAFNSWGGKRAPAFNSWGGKRAPAFNSWGGKRAPAFNSWGGKRAPAFNSWGGKRAPAFNSWGGKRAPAFNSWGGKRDPEIGDWEVPNYEITDKENAEDATEKYEYEDITERTNEQKRKRSVTFKNSSKEPIINTLKENNPNEHSNMHNSRSLTYHDNDSKRAPIRNCWGLPTFNNWDEKLTPAFDGKGEKITPEGKELEETTLENNNQDETQSILSNNKEIKQNYEETSEDEGMSTSNKHNSKTLPTFHNSGEEQYKYFTTLVPNESSVNFLGSGPDQNHPFDSHEYPKDTLLNQERKESYENVQTKRASASNKGGGKRLPAFHSWGGKRFNHLTTLVPNEAAIHFLGFSQNTPLNSPQHIVNSETWVPLFYRPETKLNYDDNLEYKPDSSPSRHVNKRLPAFHSWGGKRFKSLTTFIPNEDTVHFLGSGADQNHRFNSLEYIERPVSDILNQESKEDYEDNLEGKGVPLFNKTSDNEDTKATKVIVKRSYEPDIYYTDGKDNPVYFNLGVKGNKNSIASGNGEDTQSETEPLNIILSATDNPKLAKRSLDRNYNSEYMQQYSNFAGKRRPIFSSWGGKRNAFKPDTSIQQNRRKPKYIKNDDVIADGQVTIGSYMEPLSENEIYSPMEPAYYCSKRSKYRTRNPFMKMLLTTKSVRDLSWPTIRPIRRGAGFYSWGGKRSLQ